MKIAKNNNNRSYPCIFCKPVSYTHLDVYKRQQQCLLVQTVSLFLCFWCIVVNYRIGQFSSSKNHSDCFDTCDFDQEKQCLPCNNLSILKTSIKMWRSDPFWDSCGSAFLRLNFLDFINVDHLWGWYNFIFKFSTVCCFTVNLRSKILIELWISESCINTLFQFCWCC